MNCFYLLMSCCFGLFGVMLQATHEDDLCATMVHRVKPPVQVRRTPPRVQSPVRVKKGAPRLVTHAKPQLSVEQARQFELLLEEHGGISGLRAYLDLLIEQLKEIDTESAHITEQLDSMASNKENRKLCSFNKLACGALKPESYQGDEKAFDLATQFMNILSQSIPMTNKRIKLNDQIDLIRRGFEAQSAQ